MAECLDRIRYDDDKLHAWTYVDADYALAQARACDAADSPVGPLHGIPVGVKDVLDTSDMPTEYGLRYTAAIDPTRIGVLRHSARRAPSFSAKRRLPSLQARYRSAYAIPMIPSVPGVSSSGSAAAVADYMVPLANGTQTGGSGDPAGIVLRRR